jgi:hypothetical protein
MICLFCQAEARAEFAERSVQKLQKEVDRLEGKSHRFITNHLYCLTEFIGKHLDFFKSYVTYKLSGCNNFSYIFQTLYFPDRVDTDCMTY